MNQWAADALHLSVVSEEGRSGVSVGLIGLALVLGVSL